MLHLDTSSRPELHDQLTISQGHHLFHIIINVCQINKYIYCRIAGFPTSFYTNINIRLLDTQLSLNLHVSLSASFPSPTPIFKGIYINIYTHLASLA